MILEKVMRHVFRLGKFNGPKHKYIESGDSTDQEDDTFRPQDRLLPDNWSNL